MNRYIKYIIDDLRRSTENEEFSSQIGIPDIDFLRYLNDAQKRIHSLIVNKHSQIFLVDEYIDIPGKQEFVDLPFDIHLGNKISDVKWSTVTNGNDYFTRLYPMYQANRNTRYEGYPNEYLRKAGKLFLYPIPQNSGTLKMTYVKTVRDVALRAGIVSSVDIIGSTINNLTLNIISDEIDADELNKVTRVCLVDDEGNIKASNIRITGINESTGEVNIHPSHQLKATDLIEVGDYIVPGKYASTHSELDPIIERYIMSYCSVKILQQEGSNELAEEMNTLQALEQDIVDSYADISDDIIEIPDIISGDDEWY